MENWRRLFRERFVIEENTKERYLRKYDHRTIAEELEHFIEQLEQEAERRGRMNTCNKIKEYVESESGKSGRKEILKYIKLLEEEK